ncbi:hypothetical protein RvY_02079 [Ramazzottius varieornatus]|uniref:Receptor ligand binding region domain-containing protein n=1 Tax=Ramazzottius varieornatus TaxID=947166 RepID=A0A1D1UQI7_RAMVA|nr:hypothetical protein RvY_02079 [Ramazzottius varieornatus]
MTTCPDPAVCFYFGNAKLLRAILIAKFAFGSFFVLETDAVKNGETRRTIQAMEAVWKQQSAEVYNYTYGKNEQVISELYSDCHNRISPADGATLAQAYFNRTYHLRTGSVTLDEVGERMLGITFLQMDVNRTSLKEVMFQDPKNFEWVDIGNISWYENAAWPVHSQPQCGADGLTCVGASHLSNAPSGIHIGVGSTEEKRARANYGMNSTKERRSACAVHRISKQSK